MAFSGCTAQEFADLRPISPFSLLGTIERIELHPTRDCRICTRVHEELSNAKRTSASDFAQRSVPDARLVLSIHVSAVLDEILSNRKMFFLHSM
jgi:hypothetical protein